MKKVICENCGTKNKPKAEFCSKCGNKLPEQSKSDNVTSNNHKSSKRIYIISLVLILITGIACSLIAKSITHANDLKMATSLGITLENGQKEIDNLNSKKSSISTEIDSQNKQLSNLKKQVADESKKIAPGEDKSGLVSGKYQVGTTIKPGSYTIKVVKANETENTGFVSVLKNMDEDPMDGKDDIMDQIKTGDSAHVELKSDQVLDIWNDSSLTVDLIADK